MKTTIILRTSVAGSTTVYAASKSSAVALTRQDAARAGLIEIIKSHDLAQSHYWIMLCLITVILLGSLVGPAISSSAHVVLSVLRQAGKKIANTFAERLADALLRAIIFGLLTVPTIKPFAAWLWFFFYGYRGGSSE